MSFDGDPIEFFSHPQHQTLLDLGFCDRIEWTSKVILDKEDTHKPGFDSVQLSVIERSQNHKQGYIYSRESPKLCYYIHSLYFRNLVRQDDR
jgi:hypothetical protein